MASLPAGDLALGIPLANIDFKFFHGGSAPGVAITTAQAREQVTGLVGAASATPATRAGYNLWLPWVTYGYTPTVVTDMLKSAVDRVHLVAYDQRGQTLPGTIKPGATADLPADFFVFATEQPPYLPWYPISSVTITTTSASGTTATFNTSSDPTAILANGDYFYVSGCSVAAYNGLWTVTSMTASTIVATITTSGPGAGAGGTAYWAKNQAEMYDTTFSGVGAGGTTRMVKIFDERVKQWLIDYYQSNAVIANANFAGAMSGIELDVMGMFPASSGVAKRDKDGDTTPPWNPKTRSNVWWNGALDEWLGYSLDVLSALKFAVGPSVFVMANGIDEGRTYWVTAEGGSSRLCQVCDLTHCESFIRNKDSSVTAWPKLDRATGDANNINCWADDVNMVIDAEAHGYPIVYECSLWPSSAAATTAQSKQWHQFALASFLYGFQRWGYFSFRHDSSHIAYDVADTDPNYTDSGIDDATTVTYSTKGRHRQFARFYYSAANPWWAVINVGRPLEIRPFVADGSNDPNYNGVYKRDFTNGYVLINPLTTDVTNVPRPAIPAGKTQLKDPDLNVIGATFTLAAHSGLVLTGF